MKNFKRVLAILLAVMMVLPLAVVSSSADQATLEENWTLFGGKFAASSGIYMISKGKTGFTMTENAAHGIDVHVADAKEFGNALAKAPIAYVFCNTPTQLDNLSVTLELEDDFTFEGTYANKVGVMWNTAQPLTVEDMEVATGKKNGMVKTIYETQYRSLVYKNDVFLTNGLRGMVNSEAKDIAVLAQIDSFSTGTKYTEEFTNKVASRASINVFDGEYTDKNDGYGYRYVYIAHNYEPHCPNGSTSPIISFAEGINITDGVTFEFIPDTTLGYIVTINGKEFCHGDEIGSFPNDQGQLDDDIDRKGKSAKYLASLEYARADIDMTALVDAGDGYVLAGTCGRDETDSNTDFTVVSVNGVPAAQWNGEANTHTHTWAKDTANSIPATCTTRGFTFYKCTCGAVKHAQLRTTFDVDPTQKYADDLNALNSLSYKRVIWEDTYKTQAERDNWYREERYEILYKAYVDEYTNPDFADHALGHDYKEISSNPASCTKDGSITYECTRCYDTYTEAVAATGHAWGNWDWANTAHTARTRTCDTCKTSETVKEATSSDVNDYWTFYGKNTLSKLSAVGTINGNPEDNKITLANNSGDLAVNETRATVTVDPGEVVVGVDEITGDPIVEPGVPYDVSMVNVPVSRIMSKYSNTLDGFTASVSPVVSPNGVYNTALSFIWTTVPTNYDGYREYSVETYQDKISFARWGFLWDSYVANQEYSFVLTFLDQFFIDGNNDGKVNGSDQVIGTEGDGIYDAVMAASITAGQVQYWGGKPVNIAMSDGINLELSYDNFEMSFAVNGTTIALPDMKGSQNYSDGYYFGIASNALSNTGSSSFVVTDICGQDPATYTGIVPGTAPEGPEEPTPHKHSYTDEVTTEPTCTEKGVRTYTCTCGSSYTEDIDALGHLWGDWQVITPATTQAKGVERKTCTRKGCTAYEDRDIDKLPEEEKDVYVTNYTLTIKDPAKTINAVRIAPGTLTTTSAIKNATGVINLSATVIAKSRAADNSINYELPDGGIYSVWYKYADGTQKIVSGLDATYMVQTVNADGLKVTFNNLYGVKDIWVAKGSYSTYSQIKNATGRINITSTKIAGAHNYTYGQAIGTPGEYTCIVRYNDSTRDNLVIPFTCEVISPVITTDGRQITFSNLDGVKVVRIAQGAYTTVSQIKSASGNIGYSAATIAKLATKEGDFILNKNCTETGTVYTVAVVYNNFYQEVHQITLTKKVPTYVVNGHSITFSNIEGLSMLRYAPGKYTTGAGLKAAPGVQTIKAASITGDSVTISDLVNTYSFLVQYYENSQNFIVIDFGNK